VLTGLEGADVSPWAVSRLEVPDAPQEVVQVLRGRDLMDLFDTAPDLSGNDIDVSRFIRDVEEIDCRVLWRSWDGEEPPPTLSEPAAEELCPAPVGELRKLVGDDRRAFVWDAVEDRWRRLRTGELRPGMVVLLPAGDGGYTAETGWDRGSRKPVVPVEKATAEQDGNGRDPLTAVGRWVELAAHTRDVEVHAGSIAGAALDGAAPAVLGEVLRLAARGHDVGKALERFQRTLLAGVEDEAERLERRALLWAKCARSVRPAERNPRHELASALALLQSEWLVERLSAPWADLALFLVASHHGKARVTIRPWPQDEAGVQVLGVREGEVLPAVHVDGLALPATELRLEPLRMGDGERGASWAARMLALRDHPELGPFRVAHLEALFRAADWRASEEEEAGD
jgi:CRISPR-associated endonuclease/helicase Cas3